MDPVYCGVEVWEEEPIQPTPNQSNLGGWALLGTLVFILVFDLWALHRKSPTISQWMQRQSAKHKWFAVLTLTGLGMLAWHFIWGFPKWLRF